MINQLMALCVLIDTLIEYVYRNVCRPALIIEICKYLTTNLL